MAVLDIYSEHVCNLSVQERKRIAVKEDRRIQEISSRQNPPPEDNFERSAMKTMGAMEEGDVVFGSSDEINLDSQVRLQLTELLFLRAILIFQ